VGQDSSPAAVLPGPKLAPFAQKKRVLQSLVIGIRPDLAEKIQKTLSAMEAVDDPLDMVLSLFRFHRL